MYDSAVLTVTHGSPVSLVVGSTVSSLTAGSSATYTATAFDSFGNFWDVSGLTVWFVDSGAQGSWSGNVYTSAKAGVWTVTGVYTGLTNKASLTVTHGQPVSIAITPSNSDLTAGSSQAYTATATDSFANTWDVSGLTVWSINNIAGGLWSSNVYTSATAGTWTINGNFQGLVATSSLTVVHSYAVSIQVNPQIQTIIAGEVQVFTTTAYDHFGNGWDSTGSATFTVPERAGGSLSGNRYASANAGIWVITAISLSLTDTSSLTVTHTTPVKIIVAPNSPSIIAGANQAFTATASDTYGDLWDVSSLAGWTVSSQAGGSWTGNVYKSATAGSWVVTGTYLAFSDYAYLTVNHASAIALNVSPQTATITTGYNKASTATASDPYNNTWDTTNSAVWLIDSGAGGSWQNNIYSSVTAGTWKVSLIMGTLTATASLTVNHGTALSITVNPFSATLTAGTSPNIHSESL